MFPDSKGSVRNPTGKAILDPEAGWNGNSMSDTTVRGFDDNGSAARFFTQTAYDDDIDFPPIIYSAKASKADRNAGLEGLPKKTTSRMNTANGNEEIGNAWSPIDERTGKPRDRFTTTTQNFHPTVKPVSLMRHLIRLVTPPNGVVLDPFLGSGTTAVAAILEGCDWIGCELTEDYWAIIESRISWAQNQVSQPKQESFF
jgi:site-specific DNA-methyltransferase (adenine-specific)